MFFGHARRLCPNLHPIPYDFEAYSSVSRLLYDTVARSVAILAHFVCENGVLYQYHAYFI